MTARKAKKVTTGGIVAKRVYAELWANQIDGTWKFGDMLAAGHIISELTLSPPNLSASSKRRKTLTVGTKKVGISIMSRVATQVNIQNMAITNPEDFNEIWPTFHKMFPELVHVNEEKGVRNKPIIIKRMVTKRSGKTFVWVRQNVSAPGHSVYRLVLVSIDGKDTKTIIDTLQRKLAGPIVEDVCQFRARNEETEVCRFSV